MPVGAGDVRTSRQLGNTVFEVELSVSNSKDSGLLVNNPLAPAGGAAAGALFGCIVAMLCDVCAGLAVEERARVCGAVCATAFDIAAFSC
jgi:hypothetical protein